MIDQESYQPPAKNVMVPLVLFFKGHFRPPQRPQYGTLQVLACIRFLRLQDIYNQIPQSSPTNLKKTLFVS